MYSRTMNYVDEDSSHAARNGGGERAIYMYSRTMNYVDEDSSHAARILLLCYVIFSLIACGGSVFGFPALKEILLDEGVYEERCSDAGDYGDADDADVPCEAQLAQLDSMFTLAGSLFSVYLMPAGLCLRFVGPRFCFLAGFSFVAAGSLLFARANSQTFDVYKQAYVLIGTGNPLLYIGAFNFGKLYPRSSNLLLSVFIGCFGFSSVVFYIFNVIHVNCGLSSAQIFTGFTAFPVVLGLVGIVVLPPDPYDKQREKKKLEANEEAVDDDERTPLQASTSTTAKQQDYQTKTDIEDAIMDENGDDREFERIALPVKERSIAQQLVSAPFLAQTVFFCWGMLHQNFYLGTLGDQIYDFAGKDEGDKAARILHEFEVLYPLGCILSILPVGTLVRNTSVSTSLFVYSTANLLFSSLSLIPSVTVQWFTSTIYIVVRVGFFTVMSTYSSTIFGFKNLGTMFGFAGCFAGLCSLLGSFLSDRALNVDHSFVPVNSVLLLGAVLNFLFPLLVRRYWQ